MMDHPILHKPWEFYVKPFQVTDHIFYVGNQWVGSYLVSSDSGTILIDTGVPQTVYQLLENVRLLGFEPNNIRKILISHAHFDHAGGAEILRQYTGAELYLGAEDLFIVKEKPELLLAEPDCCPTFQVDKFYENKKPITLGEIIITPLHTPGHTPGTYSFFLQDTVCGQPVCCGMHGGLGLNTLTNEFLKNSGLPVTLQKQYIDGLYRMKEMHVDVALGSHPDTTHMFERQSKSTFDPQAFVDPELWVTHMEERIRLFKEKIG